MAVKRYRSDQFHIYLSVQGVTLDTQSWDSIQGFEMEPDMENFKPGGGAPAIAMGGVRKRAPGTLERAYDSTLISARIALDNASGVAPCTVQVVTFEADFTTVAGTETYTGILGKVTPPKRMHGDKAAQMFTVAIDANEAMS